MFRARARTELHKYTQTTCKNTLSLPSRAEDRPAKKLVEQAFKSLTTRVSESRDHVYKGTRTVSANDRAGYSGVGQLGGVVDLSGRRLLKGVVEQQDVAQGSRTRSMHGPGVATRVLLMLQSTQPSNQRTPNRFRRVAWKIYSGYQTVPLM